MELRELLKTMLEENASDLHIMAGLPPAIRISRQLIPLDEVGELDADDTQQIIYSILNDDQIHSFENDPDHRYSMDIAYGVPGLGRFRINIYKQRGTVAATIRALSHGVPSLARLNLPAPTYELTKALRGLILVTGPARSGKSSTLAALVNQINEERAVHIITIEDPIEFLHNSRKSYVSQREIGRTADAVSFKQALEQAIRQDPDVIQISRLDSYELIEMALHAADNGILVLASMTTFSVAQTISRIVDITPTDKKAQVLAQLGDNLVGIISQMLIPGKEQTQVNLAVEVLQTNTIARDAIRNNRLESIYQCLAQTMDDSFIELARNKRVDYDSIQQYIRGDSTHRKIQGILGINRPITHFPSHYTPLPSDSQIRPRKSKSDTSARSRSGDTGVKPIIPPWEKTKN